MLGKVIYYITDLKPLVWAIVSRQAGR